jgi:hypothetical protein
VKRSTFTPEAAAARAEREALRSYFHERELNQVIERRNPTLHATPAYAAGPISSWHPRWGSRAEYLRYRARREMGKYDPNVKF